MAGVRVCVTTYLLQACLCLHCFRIVRPGSKLRLYAAVFFVCLCASAVCAVLPFRTCSPVFCIFYASLLGRCTHARGPLQSHSLLRFM